MELLLVKKHGMLLPATEGDVEAVYNMTDGAVYKAEVTLPVNGAFRRKYFALLDVAFDLWNPPETAAIRTRAGVEIVPMKNRDRFRKDIAIACGHYDMVVNIKGDVRAEAKSIAWSKMDDNKFADLYSKTLDYLLAKVCHGKTRQEMNEWVETIVGFA